MFVTIEGLDGTGKSTLVDALTIRLAGLGRQTTSIHTPPGAYREIVPYLSENCSVDAQFLFFLSAIKHASDLASRHLDSGTTVVCDRYLYSTLAYHAARGAAVQVQLESLRLLAPDHAFYLTTSDEAVRQTRLRTRATSTAADLIAYEEGGLLGAIAREFRQYPMVPLDTSRRTPAELVDAVLAVIL